MTMDIEMNQDASTLDKDQIIEFLTNNETICFKSQQRGELDLNKQQKTAIALDIYNKSKLNFLMRFGRYLEKSHLDFFRQFTESGAESSEIAILLRDCLHHVQTKRFSVRNRRYAALKQMIREDSYFTEIEMMKRNPLLYDQLVGQFLTEEEREERDRININEEATLVKVLMEGIERDNAQIKRKQQEDAESEDEDAPRSSKRPAQWGEFLDEPTAQKSNRERTTFINPEEQKLLKEEFISSMYQDFLDGNDEDFDYSKIDEDDKLDDSETRDYDEEEKYFDEEEAEVVGAVEESEDELDLFMSGLSANPSVNQLSKDIEKL